MSEVSTFEKTDVQRKACQTINKCLYTLLYGGSRSGKTFILVFAIVLRALHCTSRHAIIRFRYSHVMQSIWFDTFPKVMKTCFPGVKYKENKQRSFIEFKNGSTIWFGGLDTKERADNILGNEYSTMYFNEAHQLEYASYSTACSRLAEKTALNNKIFLDCNPPSKKHWLYSLFKEKIDPESRKEKQNPDMWGSMLMNPTDNLKNISKDYIETVLDTMSERNKKRFKFGLWGADSEHALWKRSWIDPYRIKEIPEDLVRIVVGVDPSGGTGANADEIGIIVAGRSRDEHYYILYDGSMRGTANKWAAEVVEAYKRYNVDKVIAESNYGGDMVRSVIHNINRNIGIKLIHASRGKEVRAEPVSLLYEQERVHHVGGAFTELEDELCTWIPGEGKSPNRLDALVWAISELAGLKCAHFEPSKYSRNNVLGW